MQTYRFDHETKEYLRSEEAFLDPLETEAEGKPVYLLPADSTFAEPLEAKEGYAVCWNGEAWKYIEDHRQKRGTGGTPYWMPKDDWQTPARYMMELGKLPEGAMLKAPEKPAEVVAEEELAKAKAERAALVEKATVEIDGLIFDADETSQNRLSRGIVTALALGLAPDETTEWTLADNSSAMVTVRQMARALMAAGQYQTSVWRMPYEA